MISFAIAMHIHALTSRVHIHNTYYIYYELLLTCIASYMIFGIDILFIPNHTSTPVVTTDLSLSVHVCRCVHIIITNL